MTRMARTTGLALLVVLALATAPVVAAKGRPTRATLERTSCFDVTVTTTFWKQYPVEAISYALWAPGDNWLGTVTYGDASGFTSPQTRSIYFGTGASTEYVIVTLYADVGATQPLASATTAAVAYSC